MQQGAYWSVFLSVYYLTLSVSVRLNTHTHCRKACFSREVRMQITLRKTADYSTKTEWCLGMSALQQQRQFLNSFCPRQLWKKAFVFAVISNIYPWNKTTL